MSSKRAKIERLPLIPQVGNPHAATVLDFDISHYNQRYVLSATPIRIADGYESFILTHGQSVVLEAAPRFNAKRLTQLGATVKDDPRYAELKAKVIAHHKLQLVDDPAKVERDCMRCEQTFVTTKAENDDYCPACRANMNRAIPKETHIE